MFQSEIVFGALSARHVALLAGRGGVDREPDDILAGVFLLQLLHVAAGVVFLHEGAAFVEPFEDDELAFVIGERVLFAGAVFEGEGRRVAADFRFVGEGDTRLRCR